MSKTKAGRSLLLAVEDHSKVHQVRNLILQTQCKRLYNSFPQYCIRQVEILCNCFCYFKFQLWVKIMQSGTYMGNWCLYSFYWTYMDWTLTIDQSKPFGQLSIIDSISCFAINWLCLLARWDLYWNFMYSLYYYVLAYIHPHTCHLAYGSMRLHVTLS